MKNNKHSYALNIVISIVFIIATALATFGQKNESTTTSDSNLAAPKTVNAQQSGAWTVGIDPSKNTVQLLNTSQNPLSVKIENQAARTPFQKRISVVPTGLGVSSATLSIPAGKRLVIENVSVISRIPDGLKAEVNFFTDPVSSDGATELTFHRFAMLDQGTFDGTAISVANNKVLVFAAGRIVAQARLNAAATGSAQVQFTFSGYLEDLPPAQ